VCYTNIVKLTLLLAREGDGLKNKIQELRKARKVTQQELADALSVTRQTIISLENGKYNASLTLAHKAAQFFGVTIEELFIFEGEENL
jgi:putative transcriptional regulator